MKPLIILTSAINTKFGQYTAEQRLAQTLDSIGSIKKYCPDAKIALIEMAGVSLTPEQLSVLTDNVDDLFDYTQDPDVVDIYQSTENWDLVKNTTEVMIFGNVLSALYNDGSLDEFDRVFKMSGRYQLTENFKPAFYDQVPENIVVAQRRESQFPGYVTGGLTHQYMSRLWSWPADQTPAVIDTYNRGLVGMSERLSAGGYFDIEHMLYHYLPAGMVVEVSKVGVRGLLGPTGAQVED